MNYRNEAPKFYKDLNSNDILAYFEDERATQEEIDFVVDKLKEKKITCLKLLPMVEKLH